jgi:NADH:quinone reductase (non-electrogenic)
VDGAVPHVLNVGGRSRQFLAALRSVETLDRVRVLPLGSSWTLQKGCRLTDLSQAVTGQVGKGRVAIDGHDQIGLGEDRPKDVHHAVLAAEGKTPGVRTADPDGSGAEGEGLHHVGAGADAGVEQDRGVTGCVDNLALGARPNDFAIPGLAERAIPLYSVADAERVWAAVNQAVATAATAGDLDQQRRLTTVVIGGGGATGVELVGELAEMLPALARRHGLAPDRPVVILVEAGRTILAGSSPALIARATAVLADLGVRILTNSMIAEATARGFRLTGGELVEGGVFVWAGGIKAPDIVVGSGLTIGHNDRIKVDQHLRALDHPEIYAAGDLASVVDPRSGRSLPPLAQIAIEEAETVARNLIAELEERPLEAFTFHDKGFVVSVGERRGVADIAGITTGGRLAHLLKDAIEWEYRQSVKHLRGWDPLAV